jgi:hypothetical protein
MGPAPVGCCPGRPFNAWHGGRCPGIVREEQHFASRAAIATSRGTLLRCRPLCHQTTTGIRMFEMLRIKEHMEVTDAAGQHVGTVDDVEDSRIKLTRTDSADNQHHYLPLDAVDRIDDNRVYLKEGTMISQES